MFSWVSGAPRPEPGPPPPEYPPSFDPLKGLKGAAGFYELFSWASLDAPQGPPRAASAAAFYSGPVGKLHKDGWEGAEDEGAATWQGNGDAAPHGSFPGVDRVNDFLRKGKEELANPYSRCKCRIFMGSEAADLDATVSSLVYAAAVYLREAGGNPGPEGIMPVPLVSTKRMDFRLRTEASWLLKSMGIDLALLTFVDEIDLEKLYADGRLQVVLVGMKNLPAAFQGLESAVSEILPQPLLTPAADSSIGATTEDGYSCAALLAKKLSEEQPQVFLNAALSRLLLASILVSTNDMDALHSAEVDCSMAAFLISGAGSAGHLHFYRALRSRKYNQTFLTTEELLRSDFTLHDMGPGTRGKKGAEVLKVGICNVNISLADFVGKDRDVVEKVKAFKKANSLHAIFLLATYFSRASKRFKKEICIWSEVPGLSSNVGYFLQQEKNELKLRSITIKGLPSSAKAFQLGNSVITRPDVEKRLLACFDDGR